MSSQIVLQNIKMMSDLAAMTDEDKKNLPLLLDIIGNVHVYANEFLTQKEEAPGHLDKNIASIIKELKAASTAKSPLIMIEAIKKSLNISEAVARKMDIRTKKKVDLSFLE